MRCAPLAAILLLLSSLSAADPSPEVAKLIAQLKDPNEATRLKAAKELGKLKGAAKPALDALNKLAMDDPDEDVRAIAKKTIVAIKDEPPGKQKDPGKDVVAPMLKKLKSTKYTDRIAALDELTKLGEKAEPATSAIVEAMLDTSPKVREAATNCLEKVAPTLHKHVVAILYDENATTQIVAVKALGKLGPEAKAAVPVLKLHYAKRGSDQLVADTTLVALVSIAPDDPKVVAEVLRLVSLPPATLTGVNNDKALLATKLARDTGLQLLDAIEAPVAKKVAALTTALADSQHRVVVIERLAKFGSSAKTALPLLKKLKLDPDMKVRDAATKAIETISAK